MEEVRGGCRLDDLEDGDASGVPRDCKRDAIGESIGESVSVPSILERRSTDFVGVMASRKERRSFLSVSGSLEDEALDFSCFGGFLSLAMAVVVLVARRRRMLGGGMV
jgi:hypothetical protein